MRVAGRWSQSIPGYALKMELWSKAALSNKHAGSLSIVLADDAFMRDLNHTYRGKDKATNVLSFPGEGSELGDVILAYETVKEEAGAQKKSFERHAAHLVVHGCLHLVGYDHEKEQEAEKMEAFEVKILSKMGFPNPYKAV